MWAALFDFATLRSERFRFYKTHTTSKESHHEIHRPHHPPRYWHARVADV